jgi:hypothetical protein
MKPLLQAIQKALKKIQDVLNKVLKPYLDWMKQCRKLLMDFYNTYIRPIIQVIQQIRMIIHLLDLLHIHILDALDKELAKIQGLILKPFYLALYRLNTLGSWVSYMLNAYGLIYRGLFLSTLSANQGGTFSMLAQSPVYGFTQLPYLPATTAAIAPLSVSGFQSSSLPAFQSAAVQASAGDPPAVSAPLASSSSTPEFDAAVATLFQQLQANATVAP